MKGYMNRWSSYAFVLPAVVFMLLLIGYPLVYNVILSFQNVNLATLTSGDREFAGLANYKQLFSMDVFGISVKNTIIYMVRVFLFPANAN